MAFLRGLLLLFWISSAWPDDACRVAFDVGSSGVRVGGSGTSATAKVDIDFLADLWEDNHLDLTLGAVIAALKELPIQAGLADDCSRLAGGFSAWRLALELEGRDGLAMILKQIYQESGVALLVIPQRVEGSYGYLAARRGLGERLSTSHILDIGGGSFQVASEFGGWGSLLGQKAWHKKLCGMLRPGSALPCGLEALSTAEVGEARRLARAELAGLSSLRGPEVSLTAISRPVARGIFPALQRLRDEGKISGVDGVGLEKTALSGAVDVLAGVNLAERARITGMEAKFVRYLWSDLLLVEGVLQALQLDRLEVAEADLNNLPGLLADELAYRWRDRYPCYLDQLQQRGEGAYFADPEACEIRP